MMPEIHNTDSISRASLLFFLSLFLVAFPYLVWRESGWFAGIAVFIVSVFLFVPKIPKAWGHKSSITIDDFEELDDDG